MLAQRARINWKTLEISLAKDHPFLDAFYGRDIDGKINLFLGDHLCFFKRIKFFVDFWYLLESATNF